jgi:hypothetical protein
MTRVWAVAVDPFAGTGPRNTHLRGHMGDRAIGTARDKPTTAFGRQRTITGAWDGFLRSPPDPGQTAGSIAFWYQSIKWASPSSTYALAMLT